MNEQDCRAVENMALTGMKLEGLYACFPKFPREEIERIYMGNRRSGRMKIPQIL